MLGEAEGLIQCYIDGEIDYYCMVEGVSKLLGDGCKEAV